MINYFVVITVFLLLNRYLGVTEGFDRNRVFLYSLAFILYGLFGLYDDLRKIIPNKNAQKLHIRAAHQFIIQLVLSGIISYYGVKLGFFNVYIPGIFELTSPVILFILSTLVITFMVNAVNITDGLDGLGAGSFLISVVALSVIGLFNNLSETLTLFALLAGAIIGYLYYNIHPARVFNGDAGTFSVGAVLTVYMLSSNLLLLMPFFGFLYLMEGGSSFIQGLSRKYLNKKILHIAPIHHHFEYIGWPETKVTMRFWLLHIFFSVAGLAAYFAIFNTFR